MARSSVNARPVIPLARASQRRWELPKRRLSIGRTRQASQSDMEHEYCNG